MKGYNCPSILCADLLFGAVLVSPAFAEMKKVDNAEMAKTKASVTGASVKDWKDNPVLDSKTFDKTLPVFTPLERNVSEAFGMELPGMPGTWTNTFGGVGVGGDNPYIWRGTTTGFFLR
jgi:hypothetical protein